MSQSTNTSVLTKKHLSYFVVFVLIGIVAFSNIVRTFFISDDFVVLSKVVERTFSATWAQSQGGFFRPLFTLTFFIDYVIWGFRPIGFHLTNLIFHIVNSFLTVLFSRRLLESQQLTARLKNLIALNAGLLFLLHPSHTEAVSWISGRADLLATCFCLVSLLSYSRYLEDGRSSRMAFSLAAFALALLAKESAICLPLLVLVIAFVFSRTDKNRIGSAFKSTAPFIAILVGFVLVRRAFIGALVGGYGASQHLNFSPAWLRDRLLEASVRVVLPALPFGLSRFLFKPLQSLVFIVFALLVALTVALIIRYRRKHHGPAERKQQNLFLLMLLVLFLFSLMPVINLRLNLYTTLGERFIYLPSVFVCVGIAYLSAVLVRNRKLWILMMFAVLAFYSAALYRTNQAWRRAAAVCESVRNDLIHRAAKNRLVILNAPDNVLGVPLYHNGLPEAVRDLQREKEIQSVDIIAFQSLQTPFDEVKLTRDPETVNLTLINQGSEFTRATSSGCAELLDHTNLSLKIRSTDCANTDLFFFANGSMNRLPE